MWSSSSTMWSLVDLGCLIHWAIIYDSIGAIFYWFDGIFLLNLNQDHKVFDKKFDQEFFQKNCCFSSSNRFPIYWKPVSWTVFCASFKNCVQETDFLIWRNRFPESRMLFFAFFGAVLVSNFVSTLFFWSWLWIANLNVQFLFNFNGLRMLMKLDKHSLI